MNLDSERIFIVGPGGAGKSTTGKLLSEKLNFQLIDVDTMFNSRIALIPHYVRDNGYKAYCEANSLLVDELLLEYTSKVVMPLPSGFLVHEDSPELVIKHIKLLQKSGISIMLLPSVSLEETVEIIVRRQLSRGFTDINEEKERTAITRRHPLYMTHGDIQVYSHEDPNQIVDVMLNELRKLGLSR